MRRLRDALDVLLGRKVATAKPWFTFTGQISTSGGLDSFDVPPPIPYTGRAPDEPDPDDFDG